MLRSFISFVLLGFMSTSNAAVVSDQMESITQYLVMTASTIRVSKTSDPNTAQILITPSTHTLISILPTPFSRNIPPQNLTNAIWTGIFESHQIPASLTWSTKNKVEQGALVNVKLKAIQGKRITLLATLTKTVTATLADKAGYAGNPITYGVLQNASITLDDQQGRVIRSDGVNKSVQPAFSEPLVSPDLVWSVRSCLIQDYTSCVNADLSRANLYDTSLSYANFSGANLSQANLGRSNIRFTSFSGANLIEVNFAYAYLSYILLTEATLYGTVFTNASFYSMNGCLTAIPPLNLTAFNCIN